MAVVDIERGDCKIENWMLDIEGRVKEVRLSIEEQLWKNAAIYIVPTFTRDLNPKAFTPELVSFGPYHHEEPELKLMEVHKERALVHFLRRAEKPIEIIVRAVEKVVHKLQDCYYYLDEKWKSDRAGFLKMMITDGCFMLEVLCFAVDNGNGYSDTDPYFSQHGIDHKMPYIRRDMLMIENQLPLLLLKTLVEAGSKRIPEDIDGHIHELILNFLGAEHYTVEKFPLKHHPLDLYRHSRLNPPTPSPPKHNITTQSRHPQTPISSSGPTAIISCATELREAGVHFRKSNSKSLKDITFSVKDGILHLPGLVVDDATESTFLNLMAFEHLLVNVDHDVTSYVCFMDEIIDSASDVSLLHRKGIVLNALGSNEAVAGLFNRISKEVTVDPKSKLVNVRRDVYGYSQKKRNRWEANLKHTYFRNPWSALSLAGALLVIGLTIVQTIFTVF